MTFIIVIPCINVNKGIQLQLCLSLYTVKVTVQVLCMYAHNQQFSQKFTVVNIIITRRWCYQVCVQTLTSVFAPGTQVVPYLLLYSISTRQDAG